MKDPAFPFYAQDFLVGVMHMTNEEIGGYIKLLAYQWVNLGIPKKRVGFILGSGSEQIWPSISDKFIEKDDVYFNNRLEFERDKRANFKNKQAENGKKGGRPKKSISPESIENTGFNTQDKIINNPNINPIKTQKKPLENESEYEYENEKEGKEGTGEKPKKIISKVSEIILPFDTEVFRTQWQLWKVYKSKEFGFKFKSESSEQAGLNELNNLSIGDEKIAIAIMQQSMAKGWKGFFELKMTADNSKPKFSINQ